MVRNVYSRACNNSVISQNTYISQNSHTFQTSQHEDNTQLNSKIFGITNKGFKIRNNNKIEISRNQKSVMSRTMENNDARSRNINRNNAFLSQERRQVSKDLSCEAGQTPILSSQLCPSYIGIYLQDMNKDLQILKDYRVQLMARRKKFALKCRSPINKRVNLN